MSATRWQPTMLLTVLGALAWSGIAPLERDVWWMEVAPVIVIGGALLAQLSLGRLHDRQLEQLGGGGRVIGGSTTL